MITLQKICHQRNRIARISTKSTVADQENRDSEFELKQETVSNNCFFSEAELGKLKTLLKSELKFSTVSVDC